MRVVVPDPKDDARSRAGGGGSLSAAAAAAAAALPVALSLARPRTTVRREYRVSACVDTAVDTTPRESDATAAAVMRAGEDDADSVPREKDLFPRSFAAAVSDAVLSGVGCALFSLGAGKCGKSRAVRGGSPRAADSESSDSLGVAGLVADALFARRVDAPTRRPGTRSPSPCARCRRRHRRAPAGALGVASKAARRKTHEVLFDALAEGVDRAVAFEPNSNRLRTAGDPSASDGVPRRAGAGGGVVRGGVSRRGRVAADRGGRARTPAPRVLRGGCGRARRARRGGRAASSPRRWMGSGRERRRANKNNRRAAAAAARTRRKAAARTRRRRSRAGGGDQRAASARTSS